jgi:hypothetical protein
VSKLGSKTGVYRDIALTHLRGREVTIDEMREIYEAEGFWTEDELAEADREWKNAQLRRYARQRFFDEDGNPRELVNIKREKARTSEKQQFFVFIDECTKHDLEWVIEDRVCKRQYFSSEIDRFLDIYEQRFGGKARAVFQRRLNLDADDQ